MPNFNYMALMFDKEMGNWISLRRNSSFNRDNYEWLGKTA